MKVSQLPGDRKHETKLSPPRTQVGKAIIWWVQITGGNVGGGGVDGVERMTRIKEGKEEAVARGAIEHNTMRWKEEIHRKA